MEPNSSKRCRERERDITDKNCSKENSNYELGIFTFIFLFSYQDSNSNRLLWEVSLEILNAQLENALSNMSWFPVGRGPEDLWRSLLT